MAVFNRNKEVPAQKNYQKYRPFAREDFRQCCTWCLLHELLAGGKENFELDHFKPKKKFPHLTSEYQNIFYSCHVCNKKKLDHWPEEELIKKGSYYIDLTSDNHSEHFTEEPDGTWTPLTPAAIYTEQILRLNREHLVTIRRLLREIATAQAAKPIDWDVVNEASYELLFPNSA